MQDLKADVVIIGGGVAGLTTALGMAGRRVIVLTKADFGKGGSTPIAQGGIACAMGKDDSPVLHAADTLVAGDQLCISDVVDVLTKEGPAAIHRLIDEGAQFDRTPDGELSFGREAAHSRRRILHAHGDSTGAEVERALVAAVKRVDYIQVIENCYVGDLLLDQGRVVGAYGIVNGEVIRVFTPAVVLACGGIGRIYQYTTNPVESVGDGLAIAARAGAVLTDVEFVQFHPTALNTKLDPLPLLTEALRGEGSTLHIEDGTRFMLSLHKDAELAPRDVVARGIWKMQQEGHFVTLDARHIADAFPQKFPTVFGFCQQAGIDPRNECLPVTPAAHYHMGGVSVDQNGHTSVDGLWACGEVSSTGVHGANRLASNSLLEGLVFGARVSRNILEVSDFQQNLQKTSTPTPDVPTFVTPDEAPIAQTIRETMWKDVGLVRSASSMEHALALFESIKSKAANDNINNSMMLRNMLDTANMITMAANDRKESRGGHYRSDYPNHAEVAEHHPFVYTGNGPWL